MLTVQTCIGFLLTLATIHMIPLLVDAVGWRYAFAALAFGPFLGIVAMWRLRAHLDTAKLASGMLRCAKSCGENQENAENKAC